MERAKRTIEDLITAADKIIEANSTKEVDLFGEVPLKENVREILGISEQNPDYHILYIIMIFNHFYVKFFQRIIISGKLFVI